METEAYIVCSTVLLFISGVPKWNSINIYQYLKIPMVFIFVCSCFGSSRLLKDRIRELWMFHILLGISNSYIHSGFTIQSHVQQQWYGWLFSTLRVISDALEPLRSRLKEMSVLIGCKHGISIDPVTQGDLLAPISLDLCLNDRDWRQP